MDLFSPGHLIVLAIVIAILFFGWKQLPDMARSMGRSLRIFKTEIKGMTEDDKARAAGNDAPKALEATPVRPVAPAAPTVQATVISPTSRPRPTPGVAASMIGVQTDVTAQAPAADAR